MRMQAPHTPRAHSRLVFAVAWTAEKSSPVGESF